MEGNVVGVDITLGDTAMPDSPTLVKISECCLVADGLRGWGCAFKGCRIGW